MNALVESLAEDWSFTFEPAPVARAAAGRGGRGPEDPGTASSRRLACPERADLTHASNRTRRRRDRTGNEPDSQLTVPA